MYQQTSVLCWKIIKLQWNKLTIFDFENYFLFNFYDLENLTNWASFVHLLTAGLLLNYSYFLMFLWGSCAQYPVPYDGRLFCGSVVWMWSLLLGWNRVDIWGKFKCRSELDKWRCSKHMRCYCQSCWLWHPCCCSTLISSFWEFLQKYILLFYIIMTI